MVSTKIKTRTLMATVRGMAYLENELAAKLKSTLAMDGEEKILALTNAVLGIHGEIFKDWKNQEDSNARIGSIRDNTKRRQLRDAVKHILLDEEIGIFDSNGIKVHQKNLPETLAKFYKEVRKIGLFEFGSKLCLDLFMVALSDMPKFPAEKKIDFRRLDKMGIKAMEKGTELDDLTYAFTRASDRYFNPPEITEKSDLPKWSNAETQIENITFLSHKDEKGVEYIVTIDGGLIEKSKIEPKLKAWLHQNRQIADFSAIERSELHCIDGVPQYLPQAKLEELRKQDNYWIDNVEIKNGAAPLFCLHTNILTGLYNSRHIELLKLIKSIRGDKASVFQLAHNETLKNDLIAEVKFEENSEDVVRSIEIAYDRVTAIHDKMKKCVEEIFKNVSPAEGIKYLFESMGGAAAGKSRIETLIEVLCGSNFVKASLDDFRYLSEHNLVQVAAGHHANDYRYVKDFADELRTWVADYAREYGYNLLYDGSGIDYAPRYDNIAKSFSESGYETHVTMYDRNIEAAIEGVKDRAQRTGRVLAWPVVLDKHAKAALSFIQAANSRWLDKASLFATDREEGNHYLVAETFDVSSDDVAKIKSTQNLGGLKDIFEGLIRFRQDSVLKLDAEAARKHAINKGQDPDLCTVENKIANMPAFKDENTACLHYLGKDGKEKILAIYDVGRFNELLEKGTKDLLAATAEGRGRLADSARFVTEGVGHAA